MIAIAFRRTLSKVVAIWSVVGREQAAADRGGQDKSRKVRPVGRVGNAGNFNHAPNIVNIPGTLPILPMHRYGSAFDTLRRAR